MKRRLELLYVVVAMTWFILVDRRSRIKDRLYSALGWLSIVGELFLFEKRGTP